MHYKQGTKKTSTKVDFFLKFLSYFHYLPRHGIFTLRLDILSYKEIETGGVKIKSSTQPASIPTLPRNSRFSGNEHNTKCGHLA